VVQKLNRATSAEELLQAENEIYTLLLLEQRNAYSDATSVIQVVEFTNSGEPQFGSLGGMEMLTEEKAFRYFSDLEEKTLLDFQEKNIEAYPIKNYLPDSAPVLLVNPTDGEQLYWWVSYSRIGFNPSMTQALVLIGDCRGSSCYDDTNDSMYSSGFYVVLEKEGGEWVIKQRQDVWHSESEPH
jgi:hypothetical protein